MTKELTFGDIKKGDYIKCGNKQMIFHVEYIDWFDDGKLRNFKMTDVNGNSKKFAFHTKDVAFNNGSIVDGFTETETCKCCGSRITKGGNGG